jgi:hypothetical protein
MQATTLSMSALEAFAAIPLAAVCCDQTFGKEEARVIREQLLERSSSTRSSRRRPSPWPAS